MDRRIERKRVEDRRHDVDRFDHSRDRAPARRVGARIGIEHDQRHANDLVVEELLLAEAAVATELAVVGGEHDQRVVEAAVRFERREQAPETIVDLGDQAHVRGAHMARDLLAART